MASKNNRWSVGILGTGDFSRALTKRLTVSGYDVIIGSRQPESKSIATAYECNVKLVTTKECINSASILFLAVHAENVKALLENYVDQLDGKLLIDVSNADHSNVSFSNAERLQTIVPNATVVKAFNVISAYAMENEYVSSKKQVFIASDNEAAREIVRQIARDMNFNPVDCSGLSASREIESYTLCLFPGWRGPIGFSLAVFSVWLLYLIYHYYIETKEYNWEQIFVKVLNKDMCMTGITVLTVTYLASSAAALMQIYYGTKHMRFSRWLDKWMRNRKQLGLVSFCFISVHVIMSVLTMSPTYFPLWYDSVSVTIPTNLSDPFTFQNINWMTWTGEAASMTGIFSFTILCCLCAVTFPSVTDKLNWREWRFVQSHLGHVALLLAVIHVLVMAIPRWAESPEKIHKSIYFLCSILPWITLLLKIILSVPCVDIYVSRIRNGWERNHESRKEQCVRPIRNQCEPMDVKDSRSDASRCESVPMITIEKTPNI